MKAAARDSRVFRFARQNARWLAWQSGAWIAATISTGLAAMSVSAWLNSGLAAALAGSAAQNAGYYLVVLVGVLTGSGSKRRLLQAMKALIAGYAPLEVLDALVRPALIYLAVAVSPGPELAAALASLVADVVFFGLSFCFSRQALL